jgi:hypothetical protein
MTTRSITLVGDWAKAKAVLSAAPAEIEQATHMAIIGLANYLAGKIKKKIGSQVPPPNSPLTILMKKSSKTLIDQGDLRNSVTVISVKRHEAFIGIPQQGGAASLAAIHEQGRTIVMQMTPKQRRFLFATLGKKVGKLRYHAPSTGILVIHIPARPFIKPVFEEEAPGLDKKFGALVLRNLRTLAPKGGIPAAGGAVGSNPPARGKPMVWQKTKNGGSQRHWVSS